LVKQVLDLLIVDLSIGGFDVVVAFAIRDFAPKTVNCSGDDSLAGIALVYIISEDFLVTGHSIGPTPSQ
jgi:hypothetical protein